MKHYITFIKELTYDLDKIMKERQCDYDTAIEIAYDYFDEAKAYYNISVKEEEEND